MPGITRFSAKKIHCFGIIHDIDLYSKSSFRPIPCSRMGSQGSDTDKEQRFNINSCRSCAWHYFKCLTIFEGAMLIFDSQKRTWRHQEALWLTLPHAASGVRAETPIPLCQSLRLDSDTELLPRIWIQRTF